MQSNQQNQGASGSIHLPSSLKNKIIDTIRDSGNRLTIVVGGTGCGKSTLVPQLLLDNIGHPILCTQPRRLAVVAVSNHVAKQRNTAIGDEVGYHVGQNRVSTHQTKLVFATAGILLEELKSNGLEALTKYKAVLIDECHERSAQSDLCLVIIKSFMTKHPHANIRIILMSATFNQGKYRSYFQNVPGCETINTITLETAMSINAYFKHVKTFYLEDILEKIPRSIRRAYLAPFERMMRLDPDSQALGEDGGKSLSSEMLIVIKTLVASLHAEEPSEAKFLIFAPTYRHLEQIHSQLTNLSLVNSSVLVDVLHSSIDIEDCLSKMQPTTDHAYHHDHSQRHILLASAIADSSVTIPGVTCVIDTCRALEVKWDVRGETHVAKTIWASKSICDQRRGRTGRTCPGRVFRLVNQSYYINNLNDWDQPQIEFASCRDEMLALLSSTNKVFSNPQALLKRCLDPPPDISVNTAMQYLERVGACTIRVIGNKVKLIPTDLGRLLASLPYTISDANMIVRGAKNGILHEALVIVSILSTRPYPILHTFAENDINESIQRRFYPDVDPRDPKSVAVANFAAYLFWCTNWKINIRQKLAKSRFLHCTKSDGGDSTYLNNEYNSYPDEIDDDARLAHDCKVWEWNSEVTNAHIQWCKKYYINPTSVRAIDANIDIAFKTLYHKDHEPEWLRCQTPASKWSSQIDSLPSSYAQDIFQRVYGYEKGHEMCQMLLQLQDPSIPSGPNDSNQYTKEETACIHFLNGNCSYGDDCRSVHSFTAPRPICRFFLKGGCTKRSCLYSHTRSASSTTALTAKPPTFSHFDGGVLEWFRKKANTLLLFGEADFLFTKALASLQIHPSHATTEDSLRYDSSIENCHTLGGVDATRCHTNMHLKAATNITTCAWNFPYTGQDEDDVIHTSLLSGAFMSVATYLEGNLKYSVYDDNAEFALTLQGDQLSRWTVLESAQRAGFHLHWWEEFDEYCFPGYTPKRGNGERFPAQHARFYVFRLSTQ